MTAGITENLDGQIGRAIHDSGLIGELGRAGDEAAQTDNAGDTGKIAIQCSLGLGQNIDQAGAGTGHTGMNRNFVPELAGDQQLAIHQRKLTGDDELVSGANGRNVIRNRSGCDRQGDLKVGEAGVGVAVMAGLRLGRPKRASDGTAC